MEKSVIVEGFKAPDYPERTNLLDPDPILCQKAYIKLCTEWNNSENSRKFVKHLAMAFGGGNGLPIESAPEGTQLRCCILNVRLALLSDVKSLIDEYGEDLISKSKIHLDEQVPKDEYKKLQVLRKQTPIERKNGTIAYGSSKSDKILSHEAAVALKAFVEDCKNAGEKEIVDMLNYSEKKKSNFKNDKKKFNPSFAKKQDKNSKNQIRNLLDENSWKVLESLKK